MSYTPPLGDATGSTKGVIRLTGDLGGTATSPTVPGLAGKANSVHTHTAASVTDLTESTQDTIASTLVAGTNVTLNYDDGAGNLTISAASGGGGAVDSVNGQTGVVVLDIDDVAPNQTNEGGKVLGTDGTNTTWTALPVTPPAVATDVYGDANEARPINADIVFWIPNDPAVADPLNAVVGDVVLRSNTIEPLTYALSDEATAITAGTAKLTVRAPFAFTLTSVRASLTTASSSGVVTVDINEAGSTILSTKLTIDEGERTSLSAATQAVVSDALIADDAELTFDIDTAGTSATGLKVTIFARRF